jgi:hypothetical protein
VGRSKWAAINADMWSWASRYRHWRNNQPRNLYTKGLEQFFGVVFGALGGGYLIFRLMLGAMYLAIDYRLMRYDATALAVTASIGLVTILLVALLAPKPLGFYSSFVLGSAAALIFNSALLRMVVVMTTGS